MADRQRNQMLKGKHGGMQLVLTEDVQHLGRQGDVVEVKPGYGRNYLLPRGLATVPTQHNLRLLERYKIRVRQAREARLADLRALAGQLQNLPGIIVEANANEEGHLYGSVGAVEISRALKAKALPIEPEMVRMEGGAIREIGGYAVKLTLAHDDPEHPIEAEIKVLVKPQDKK